MHKRPATRPSRRTNQQHAVTTPAQRAELAACVVCGAGASLNNVNPFDASLPVVAISTAIRTVREPNVWVLVDKLRKEHGPEGRAAMMDRRVLKVMPEFQPIEKFATNVERVPTHLAAKLDRTRKLFDGQLPLLRSYHSSILFGIQWLVAHGCRDLVFCGIDFTGSYSYGPKHGGRATLAETHGHFNRYIRTLAAAGVKARQWRCGTSIHKLMPSYE